MKYLLILFSLFTLLNVTTAQNLKVQTCWSLLTAYDRDQKADDLLKAVEAIDQAVKHENTMNSGKAWFYHGKAYYKLYENEELKNMHKEAHFIAYQSFKKTIELNDKKFRDADELYDRVRNISSFFYNTGVDKYQKEEYADAFKNFSIIGEVNEFLTSNGQKKHLEEEFEKTAILYAGQSAEQSGNPEQAIELYNGIIENGTDEPRIYRLLSNLYKSKGDKEKAQEVLQKGIAKFPENVELVIDDLNYYLADDRHEEALAKLKKAISLDENNDQLHFVLGTAYDKLEDFEAAQASYEKAVEINPENYNAVYNIGAIFFRKAGVVNDEMNELGYNEQKKYDELKVERDALFLQAKPYFDRAAEINPEDPAVQKALRQIEGVLE